MAFKYIVKVDLPEINGKLGYLKFISAGRTDYVELETGLNKLRKKLIKAQKEHENDDKEVSIISQQIIDYNYQIVKDRLQGGEIYDLDDNVMRPIKAEDIDNFPMSLIESILGKIFGNDLKVS